MAFRHHSIEWWCSATAQCIAWSVRVRVLQVSNSNSHFQSQRRLFVRSCLFFLCLRSNSWQFCSLLVSFALHLHSLCWLFDVIINWKKCRGQMMCSSRCFPFTCPRALCWDYDLAFKLLLILLRLLNHCVCLGRWCSSELAIHFECAERADEPTDELSRVLSVPR